MMVNYGGTIKPTSVVQCIWVGIIGCFVSCALSPRVPLHFLNWVSNCIFVIIILAYGIQLWVFFLIVINVKILVQNKEAVPLAKFLWGTFFIWFSLENCLDAGSRVFFLKSSTLKNRMQVFCSRRFDALLMTSTSSLLFTCHLFDSMWNKHIEVNLTTISSETKQITRSFCHYLWHCFPLFVL